jgi:hypothetical protein
MKKLIYLLLFTFSIGFSIAQSTVKISGVTTGFVGKKIEFYLVKDYLSLKDSLVGEATIQKDSSFQVLITLQKTEKVIVKCHKNTGFIYASPGGSYTISLPDKDPYNAFRPQGNKIEISFLDLPKTDVNFKIIEFDNWIHDFLGVYLNRKTTSTLEFSKQLDTFKLNVEKYYKADTSNFFKTYVRYSIASLDDINCIGMKTRIEKYMLYLKDFPVNYENDKYMDYTCLFYKNIFAMVSTDLNQKIYKAILSSSPSQLMRTLGTDATLRSPRIRELVAIQALSEVYNGKDYPKSNILTMLDSIARFGLYKQHRGIAKRIIERLTELAPGMKAPNFEILSINQLDTISLQSYNGSYIYLQFVDPTLQESKKHIDLLVPLFEKYGKTFRFVTIIEDNIQFTKEQLAYYGSIPWEKYYVSAEHPILKRYHIKSFPSYVMIDETGILHSYPAAGPIPNGEYETVEKVLYTIKRRIETEKMNKEKSGFDDIFDDTK